MVKAAWRGVVLVMLLAFIGGCAATKGGSAPAEAAKVAAEVDVVTPPPGLVASERSPGADSVAGAHSIYFSNGGSEIDSDGMALLRQCADRLKSDSRQRVTVVGMTNDLGSRTFNLALADRRITNVQHTLRRMGVAAHQIKRRNLAGDMVRQRCADESCRKLMRRVDLLCTD